MIEAAGCVVTLMLLAMIAFGPKFSNLAALASHLLAAATGVAFCGLGQRWLMPDAVVDSGRGFAGFAVVALQLLSGAAVVGVCSSGWHLLTADTVDVFGHESLVRPSRA